MLAATYAAPEGEAAATAHVDGREVPWRVHPELAAAGLWCTPVDLVRFAQAIQTAVADDAFALLPQPLALEMLTPQVDDWGLGLRLSGDGRHRRFSHGGHNYGYQCALVSTVYSARAVGVMTGSDKGNPVIGSLLAVLRESTGWSDLPTSPRPTW